MGKKVGLGIETQMRGAGEVTYTTAHGVLCSSQQIIQVEQGIFYTLVNMATGNSYIYQSDSCGKRTSCYAAYIFKSNNKSESTCFCICDSRQEGVQLVTYLYTHPKTALGILRDFCETKHPDDPGRITAGNKQNIVLMLEGIAKREIGISDIRVYDVENCAKHTISVYALRKALLAAFKAGARFGR